ncbi:hypothetical protein [Mycetocola reblochoni]|uniref:Uncharacterized protein n=2 Tax=Mycetocola reblochoni TaxID=331618 RepID=A0A1R4JGR8_9MICO|nr:hypothetical protein [Mycetocola reblochoni]RLP68245.1 hypothetical protein D9V30_11100 [Mycetocola reblochoni]SJN31199.1 hypothetical protein FM119_07450 [Mycetocola reblochoni REB411]
MTEQFSGVAPATQRLYRRQLRRITHRSRSVLVGFVLVLLTLVVLWLGVETVLWLLGAPALLVAPGALVAAVVDGTSSADPVVTGGAVAAVVVGVVLVALSLGGARRARHGLSAERIAVVVDDRVLASAAARAARVASGVDSGQVTATVGRRSVQLRIRPSSGFRIDEGAVVSAVEDELTATGTERLRVSVHVDQNGKVGA